jgi:hypothetical protein
VLWHDCGQTSAAVGLACRPDPNTSLAPWTTFEPTDRLMQAFNMAQKRSALQQAISMPHSPSMMQVR